MGYDEDMELFEETVGEAINQLRDNNEWSDQKVARFLREEARSLDPPKPRRKVIDPLTVTDEELSKYSTEFQEKVKKTRNEMIDKINENMKKIKEKWSIE